MWSILAVDEMFPADSDGEALRRLREGGSNMRKPHLFDFYLCFSEKPAAQAAASQATQTGFIVDVEKTEDGRWCCICHHLLMPTYESVVDFNGKLAAICADQGGVYKGWGTMQVR